MINYARFAMKFAGAVANWEYGDTDRVPLMRDVDCMNCGGPWFHHHGWACYPGGALKRSELDISKRYLTPDMAQTDAISFKQAGRAWRGLPEGGCPCGIARIRCDYHGP